MRISAGHLKGRKIRAGRISSKREGKEGFRPTSSKVREAVFDILKNEITDVQFLDLYAGSGTVGFEALSRGAANCCFVEQDPGRFRKILSSVKNMTLDDRASAFREDAASFLERSSKSGETFQVIFADPPYACEDVGRIFLIIDETDILRKGGVLMIEHSSRRVLQDSGRSLRLVRNYKYGDTALTFFRKET